MSLKVKEVGANIYQVTAPTAKSLANTFVRFQEYYENPTWQGKIFTLGNYMAWYKHHYGTKYYKDWSGFNIPGSVLSVFRKGLFDPLTTQEKKFLNLFKHIDDVSQIYIIGIKEGDSDTMEHEICHALYTTSLDYRTEMDFLINKWDTEIQGVLNMVAAMMYATNVQYDEVQAYIVADSEWLSNERHLDLNKDMINEFREVRAKYNHLIY